MHIELTEDEIIMILDAIGARIDDLNEELVFSGDPETVEQITALADLDMDLREATFRGNDGAIADPMPSSALRMVRAGIDAREQSKASSMAAERRVERMMKGTATTVDVWSLDSFDLEDK